MNGTGSSLATRFRLPPAWRDFAAFLRRPTLPETVSGINRSAAGATLSLLALDLLFSAMLVALFIGLEAIGVELPASDLEDEELTTGLLVLIALVAPPIEEVIFRSWLTGNPAAATILKFSVGGALLGAAAAGFAGPFAGLAVVVIALALAVREYRRRRGRPPSEWYAKRFPYFYFGSAVAFAAVHLSNYGEEGGGILTLLVVPQLLGGLVLGYARVTFGLWSSIAMHMAFNSLLVGLMLLAKAFGS
jgi:membrane protease YdiL (CAAX protease family)